MSNNNIATVYILEIIQRKFYIYIFRLFRLFNSKEQKAREKLSPAFYPVRVLLISCPRRPQVSLGGLAEGGARSALENSSFSCQRALNLMTKSWF